MNKKVAKILANKKFYTYGVRIQIGRLIPIYWNPKAALSDPEVLKAVAREFARTIRKIRPKIEVIAGGATGGISLAAATALELKLPWVYIRAQPKGYSTNVLVEGGYKKGARAILVDDVIASGSAKEIFIKNSDGQLDIKDIMVILDDTGGKYPDWFKQRNINLYSMLIRKERDLYFKKIGFYSAEEFEFEQAYEKNRDDWQNDEKMLNKFNNFIENEKK